MKLDYLISWLLQSLLIVAFLSGLPLVFFYYPDHAYNSVQKITNIIPYGSFFRSLHYFSSETAVFFLIIHTFYELFLQKKPKEKSNFIYASVSFLLVLFLLYTGYVLKADQSGKAAALVGENIIKDSFFLRFFSNLIIDKTIFYWKFFLWHMIFLPCFMFWFAYLHIKKRLYPNLSFLTMGLGFSFIIMYLIPMPSDMPYNITAYHLKGPWFFQGIENMLRLNFPVDLSVFIGVLPFLLVSLYIYLFNYRKILNVFIFVWIVYYTAITLYF